MKTTKVLFITSLALGLALAPVTATRADEAAAKDKKARAYPLKTCLVSGDKLGEMGDPFVFVKDGQEFKTCCKSCKKDIDKDPKKFLAKLADEVKKQEEARKEKK